MLIKIAASATRTQAGFKACMLRQPKMARIRSSSESDKNSRQVRFLKSSNVRLDLLIKRYNLCTVGLVEACSVLPYLLAPLAEQIKTA